MYASDAMLVVAARAGQRDALDELVRRHASAVMAVCCARIGRAGPLEDLAQDAFMRAFQSLETLSEPEKFGAWIRGIAIHACLDWLKKKERKQVALDGSIDRAAPPLEEDERSKEVLDAVESLDEIHREVVTMFYFDRKSYKEMSALLGITPAAINARLQKARGLLREKLASGAQSPSRAAP